MRINLKKTLDKVMNVILIVQQKWQECTQAYIKYMGTQGKRLSLSTIFIATQKKYRLCHYENGASSANF